MEENKNIFQFENIDNKKCALEPFQSANTLFRFFTDIEFLKDAIRKSALTPRYYREEVEYLNIQPKTLAYPMICFCDINFHKLEKHIETYGEYGIAFSKEWGENKGVQPIQYINPSSVLCKDLSEAFKFSMTSEENSITQDYLLTHMFFIKPIKGTMIRNDNKKEYLFTDECEWRYIPDLKAFDLPPLLVDKHISTITFFNELIASKKELWLNFEYEDIKYIIVKRENDFYDVCNLIISLVKDEISRHRLISKIRVWSNERRDF